MEMRKQDQDRLSEQREREDKIRKAEEQLIELCDDDSERLREAAGRVLRAWYYRQIRGMAEGIRAEITAGTITDTEGIDRRIDEYADCDLTIYTGKAMDVYNASDSRDAWQETTDKIGELSSETDDIPWPQIAAYAITADLREYLSEDIEKIERDPDDDEEEG